MAHIGYVSDDQIPPEDRVPDQDNILRIHGVHPRTMRQHYDLYLELMRRPGAIGRIDREMIAVAVSAANECHYWLTHHGAGLRDLLVRKGVTGDEIERLLAALAKDHAQAALEPRQRAMLDYALKLTRTPGQMAKGDVDALRAAGFDDRAVHDICAITAYFAFVNRVADGLGVELEPRF